MKHFQQQQQQQQKREELRNRLRFFYPKGGQTKYQEMNEESKDFQANHCSQ